MNKQKAVEMAKELGPEYKYVAMDCDGNWHAFIEEPIDDNGWWINEHLDHKWLFEEDYSNKTLTKVYDDE